LVLTDVFANIETEKEIVLLGIELLELRAGFLQGVHLVGKLG
jgi:hypothetical protein